MCSLFLGVPSPSIAPSPPDRILLGSCFLRTLQVRQSSASEGTLEKAQGLKCCVKGTASTRRNRFLARVHHCKNASYALSAHILLRAYASFLYFEPTLDIICLCGCQSQTFNNPVRVTDLDSNVHDRRRQ